MANRPKSLGRRPKQPAKPTQSDRDLMDHVLYRYTPPHSRKAALIELMKRSEAHGYDVGRASHTQSDGMS